MKAPPASYFIKKAACIESGSATPGHDSAGTISMKHIYEIAQIKHKDIPTASLESVCRSLIGTCRSMGIKVVNRPEDG